MPTQSTFRKDGGKGNRKALHGYVRFLIQDHASRSARPRTTSKKAKKKRGAFDLALPGLDQPAREAAWRSRVVGNEQFGEADVGPKAAFPKRTGGRWREILGALKAERKDMKVAKAKADGKVRVMTREVKLPDALLPGQGTTARCPSAQGHRHDGTGFSIGDPKSAYIIRIVRKGGQAPRRVSGGHGRGLGACSVENKASLEQKLRRVGMTNNARCVTTALTTTGLHPARGESGRARAGAAGREAARSGAARRAGGRRARRFRNRGDVRACLTACGDAPSVGFGAAAGGVLRGGAASRGALPSGRLGAASPSAAAVSDEAPASLGDAFQNYDWVQAVVARASSRVPRRASGSSR